MAKKNWIKGSIKHLGALTAKANRAHMGNMAFARKHYHDSGKTGMQAREAVTLSHLAKHRKSGHGLHARH